MVGNPNRDSEFLARKLRNNCKRIVDTHVVDIAIPSIW